MRTDCCNNNLISATSNEANSSRVQILAQKFSALREKTLSETDECMIAAQDLALWQIFANSSAFDLADTANKAETVQMHVLKRVLRPLTGAPK